MNQGTMKGDGKVECLECGKRFEQLSTHLGLVHGMSTEQYREKHPGAETIGVAASKKGSVGQKGRWSRARRQKEKERVAKVMAAKTDAQTAQAADPSLPKDEAEDLFGTELEFGPVKIRIRADLSERDRAFVPEHDPHYEFDDESLQALALGLANDDNVLIVGPTGCGKSSGALELLSILNWPTIRVNLNGDFRAADFLGEKVLDVDPETGQSIVTWKDGIAPTAATRGYALLLDEIDAAPPEILFALQALLEQNRRLVLTGDGGRVVRIAPTFRIIATANTLGRGDDTGLYTGTNVLNEAFLDRFGIVIQQGYPVGSKEIGILVAKTGIERSKAEKMVEVATTVRLGYANEDCGCTFSLRRLLSWAEKSGQLGTRRASEIAVLNKLGPDDRKFVAGVLQRHFGRSEP